VTDDSETQPATDISDIQLTVEVDPSVEASFYEQAGMFTRIFAPKSQGLSRSLLLANSALLVAIIATVLGIAKVYTVAGGNEPLALALVNASSKPAILLGTATESAPVLQAFLWWIVFLQFRALVNARLRHLRYRSNTASPLPISYFWSWPVAAIFGVLVLLLVFDFTSISWRVVLLNL